MDGWMDGQMNESVNRLNKQILCPYMINYLQKNLQRVEVINLIDVSAPVERTVRCSRMSLGDSRHFKVSSILHYHQV